MGPKRKWRWRPSPAIGFCGEDEASPRYSWAGFFVNWGMTMQLMLSVWGAGLSTILATVNLYRVYKSRTRFSTSYYFDGLAGSADKIVIYSIGKVDIIINDYKLFFFSRSFLAKKEYLPDYSEPHIISIQVKANDKRILTFNDPDRINLKKIGKRNLYLELRIVGKRTGKILKIC